MRFLSVRVYALQALASGDAVLLRILPDGDDVVVEEGAVTVQNTCLSGGGIEIFLDPVLPAPRVVVVCAYGLGPSKRGCVWSLRVLHARQHNGPVLFNVT